MRWAFFSSLFYCNFFTFMSGFPFLFFPKKIPKVASRFFQKKFTNLLHIFSQMHVTFFQLFLHNLFNIFSKNPHFFLYHFSASFFLHVFPVFLWKKFTFCPFSPASFCLRFTPNWWFCGRSWRFLSVFYCSCSSPSTPFLKVFSYTFLPVFLSFSTLLYKKATSSTKTRKFVDFFSFLLKFSCLLFSYFFTNFCD